MSDLAVAFFWHQHQPYYPDDAAGENPMPWVRLHGVKDYYGMAKQLLEFPEMRCTINLVPSLVLQLQAYTDKGAGDRLLDISRIPADSLSEPDCLYLLDHFFMANAEQMIRPHPRYWELYLRRAPGKSLARESLRRFKEKDLRDLQVWFNLAWIHPLAFEEDADLRGLRDKERDFTEADKRAVLDKQLGILKQIIPLHTRLAQSGQIELTTTPYYHPILPLLLDKKLAREAMPEVKLPRFTSSYPEDAETQVARAVQQHTQVFGKPPRGMWPAEGSVCQSMIPLLARHGIQWIATDEEILSQSTQGFVSRDSQGHLRNPEHLYRPYKVKEGDAELGIVFRDHALSDLIGFHYQRSLGAEAADDFLRHVHGIRQAVAAGDCCLVSVILDGENCWEHYSQGGVPFLRALYQKCTTTKGIRPVQIGEYLETHPPRDTLPRLFAGSWIRHNFGIWIGHQEDNTGWDALHKTREHLRQRALQPHLPRENIANAWEEIYIAEGSDWFWWYGDEHTSAQDALFDQLFRKHLQNVYHWLGEPSPDELARPIMLRVQRPLYTAPRSFLNVKVDGRETFFEWLGAGHYTCRNERGTMAQVTPGPLRHVYFGFNLNDFLLRVDCDGPAKGALSAFDAVRIAFVEPEDVEIRVEHPGRPEQQCRFIRGAQSLTDAKGCAVCIDRVVEAAVAFDLLGVAVDAPIQFYVELLEAGQSRDRAPREGVIQLTRPSPDFERIMWDV